MTTGSRCLNWNDRATIAHLATRVRALREGMPDNRHTQVNLINVSAYQLGVLEECLLTRLTLMTKGGWAWFSEDEDLTADGSAEVGA